jgi:hypothetical protein
MGSEDCRYSCQELWTTVILSVTRPGAYERILMLSIRLMNSDEPLEEQASGKSIKLLTSTEASGTA